ncbi:hypothetical protein ABPG75_004460 [Micractinium tetrahymenae]
MPPQLENEAALFKAAQAGKLDDVLRIAEELGGDIKTFTDANGANCLHVAAHAGQTALCKHLVDELNFDINSQDGGGTGNTPLVLALAHDQWDTAEALLAAGADPNRRSSSPADAPDPLHVAVAAGKLELAKAMLAAGADPNARSSSGTPLELAAARSNVPMVAALLAAGADANAAARQGLTPLFMAVAVGSSADVVRELVGAGADVNGRALGAFTPLHVAAEGGKLELVEALLQAGANPSAKDEHGHTPAKVAAMHKHRAVVEALLRRGGDGASGSGSGSGEAAAGGSGGGVDELIASSTADLKEREEKASSSGAASSGGASAVAIPSPECPDEALGDTFKRKGNEFFVAGDYEGAAKLYELSLSHWTKNPVVWSNRAACFLRMDKWDKALQDAQIARTLDPKYVKAWYREGRAAEGLKRWEDAATAFYQAAQLQPDNEEFIRLTKEAIVEGRKEYQAQQAAQQAQQGQHDEQQQQPTGAVTGSDAAKP